MDVQASNSARDRSEVAGTVLDVVGLNVTYQHPGGDLYAVRDVSLSLRGGEIVGIIGESGSGKSSILKALIGQAPPNARVSADRMSVGGLSPLTAKKSEFRSHLGKIVGTVFQDPVNALNPSITLRKQFYRFFKLHRVDLLRKDYESEMLEALRAVGVDAEGKLDSYPFEFSQGQLQRVMIALATASSEVRLLLADEATSSLDVTIQEQILQLLCLIRDERNLAVLIVTHDIGVISRVCDRVIVMYGGRVVEVAAADVVERGAAAHPYTVGLLGSVPRFPSDGRRLVDIPGAVPDLRLSADGCTFAPRCNRYLGAICDRVLPVLLSIDDRAHQVACHLYDHEAVLRQEGDQP